MNKDIEQFFDNILGQSSLGKEMPSKSTEAKKEGAAESIKAAKKTKENPTLEAENKDRELESSDK